MAPFGIVLAAGSGTRMGGPKALLRVGDRTLTERHVERLLEAGCERVVVVTRPELATALVALLPPQSIVVEAATESPAESLAVAARCLESSSPTALVIVTPVDLLPATTATIERLLAAVRDADGVLAATPSHGGKGGHPVVARLSILRAGLAQPLRDRLQALGAQRLRVVVDDPAVIGDFDRPADLPPRS
jgi:molybdenum cofactor cytidylyltransferase